MEHFDDFSVFTFFFGFGVFAEQPTGHSGGVSRVRLSLRVSVAVGISDRRQEICET